MQYYRLINGIRYDRFLLNSAEFKTRGKGDGRISEQDARELWREAMDGGRITESEERSFIYLLDTLNWTESAEQFIRQSLTKEKETLKSYYQIINGKRHDRRLLLEAEKLVKSKGDGRISLEDAKDLWPYAADSGEIKVEENRSIQLILEQYNWTEIAKEWFEARVLEISKEPEETTHFLSLIQYILHQQFQVPNLQLEYNLADLQKQVYLPKNNLSFDEALEMALESIFYYRERNDSFRMFILNVFKLDYDPDKEATELLRTRESLSNAKLSLLPDESYIDEDQRQFDPPPNGESILENWIFLLQTKLSDHVFYIIVDRSGETDAYNYGFN